MIGKTYLYFEAGLNHGVEPLDEEHLATRLAWLTQIDQPNQPAELPQHLPANTDLLR